MGKLTKIDDYALYNKETGEIYDLDLHRNKNYLGGIWMITNLDALKMLRIPGIRGETLRVFLYVLENLAYNNIIPSNKNISGGLKIHYSNVNRAMRQLHEICAIVEDDGISILNPHWGWRGNQKFRQATIKRLQDKGVKL